MNASISDTSYWILKIMYFLFGMYIVLTTYKRIKKDKKASFFDFYNLFYFIRYCISPFFVLDNLKEGKYFKLLMTVEEKYYYFAFAASVLVYFIVKSAYNIFMKIKTKEKNHYIDIDTNSNRFFITNSIILLFSWICLILWTYEYGSIFGMFQYASLLRDGKMAVRSFSFLSKFCAFFAFTSYNFIIIMINDYKNKSKRLFLSLMCLIISLFGTFIYMINIDSRGYIVVFFIILILYFFDKKIFDFKFKTLIILLCIVMSIIFMVSKMDQITTFIKTGKIAISKQDDNFFAKEYSYVYTNNVNIFYMYENNYGIKFRFFDNLRELPYVWIPKSKKPVEITDLNDYNTSFYENATGELPADIVTASMYTFGYIGLIINPIIYAGIIAFMTKKIKFNMSESCKVQKIIYYYMNIGIISKLVGYVDIAPILTDEFGFIIFYIIIYFTCGQKKIKKEYLIEDKNVS